MAEFIGLDFTKKEFLLVYYGKLVYASLTTSIKSDGSEQDIANDELVK